MKKFFRILFNYYLVFKTCWAVLLFLVIGYFALAVFDQGLDVLREIGFGTDRQVNRKTFIAWLAVSWWGWQSWRASRMILHFSYFNFWNYQPAYAFRAQVLVPRLLALIPFGILSLGLVKAQGGWSTIVVLLISTAIWMFIFFHFRRRLIVWIRSRSMRIHQLIPDYIPIKNGMYPSRFIWAKQWKWIVFRLVMVLGFFLMFIFVPVGTAQYMGASAVVLFGFGCWLILASMLSMIERHIHLPVTFTVFMAVVLFGYFNNNHNIRTLENRTSRPTLQEHFNKWLLHQPAEPEHIYLVAAEGGGIRSAYWTSAILFDLHTVYPDFDANLYAISSVSGGSLGAVVYESLRNSQEPEPRQYARQMLQKDYLAPVTAGLIFPDILQKIIPFPVGRFDRAKILEKSWEKGWRHSVPTPGSVDWTKGFAGQMQDPGGRVLCLNSTHVESGFRTLISNVDLEIFENQDVIDFFKIHPGDIPVSTAVGLSARFPLLTPPARISGDEKRVWGHLVDGGYYENMGANTLFDLYSELRGYCLEIGIQPEFRLIVIRNTKSDLDMNPVRGMPELLPPFVTLSRIWSHQGSEVIRKGRQLVDEYGDELLEIKLDRSDNENIPLGWYLSRSARYSIERQIRPQLAKIRNRADH